MVAATEALAQEFRSSIQLALVQQTKGVVIHDMSDKLEMARLCEAIWPSRKTTKIRSDIEAERRMAAR